MIRAVVFDLGGVLFSEGKSVALEKLAATQGYDPQQVGAILSSPKSIQLRKGLISDENFWRWAEQQWPAGYDSRLIRQEWTSGYVLDDDICSLIASLRNKYLIVAFSGNVESRVAFLEEKYHFRRLFDIEVYSFDFHLTKPEPEFVRIMIQKSGARPEEIVYVDDNDAYAKPAREMGVNVVIYRRGEIERLRQELKRLGVAC